MTRDQRNDWLAFGAGLAAPPAVAGAMVPLRAAIDNANVALVLAAVVVGVAVTARRPAALAAAASAAVWFDFCHTRPYERCTIKDHNDLVTAGVLLLVGIVVGEVAIRARRHWMAAAERSDEIVRLHAVAELVADGEPAEYVVMVVAHELRQLLSVHDCRFDRGSEFVDERVIARLERTGEVTFGQFRWGVDKHGFPGPAVELLVQGQGQTFGRYVFNPTPGQAVSLERRVVAVALADQVGAAFAARPATPADA